MPLILTVVIGVVVPNLAWSATYDFEDGRMPSGHYTQMAVGPKILAAPDGNHFLRITGSRSDCESIPSGQCPPRNRSTVTFTEEYDAMPLLSPANQDQLYGAKLRFHDDTGSDGVVFELFQDGAQTGGYGTRDGQGPVFICWRDAGSVACRANYANETRWDMVSLGRVPADTWHTLEVGARWSHDPGQGRIEVVWDGTSRLTVTGRDVNLGPTSNRLPSLKLGLYGDNAVGVLDVDEVSVGAGAVGESAGPAPTAILPPPTNLRLVEQ